MFLTQGLYPSQICAEAARCAAGFTNIGTLLFVFRDDLSYFLMYRRKTGPYPHTGSAVQAIKCVERDFLAPRTPIEAERAPFFLCLVYDNIYGLACRFIGFCNFRTHVPD